MPDFQAARTPRGTAIVTAKMIVVNASAMVGSIRCAIKCDTGN